MPDMLDDDQEQSAYSRSARHKKKKRAADKNTKGRKTHLKVKPALAVLFLLMVLCAGALSGYHLVDGGRQAPVDISSLPQDQQQAAKDERALQNLNILCVGCDQRGDESARADVIMLVTLRPVDGEISVLSVPRDMRVSISGHGKDKINHALAFGEMPLLQETVENFLGIKIDHTVKINFDGFINVIDALGGVDIDVETKMYKPTENIDLKPGPQRLNGYDALAYVRWRGDGTADLGRIQRQQKFLGALADSVKSMSLKEFLSAGGAILDSMETDMSIADMTRYGVKFLGITPDNIETHSLRGKDARINGISYQEPDQAELKTVMELMIYGVPEETNSGENPENGSGE